MNRRLRIPRQESFRVNTRNDCDPLRSFADRPAAPRPCLQRGSRASGRAERRQFLLRIEDLDQGRSRPEFVDGIYEDLRWLGLDWDEPVLVQSRADARPTRPRSDELRDAGLVYPCFCTRADIAAVADAPHGDAATSYPGTCRALARRSRAPRDDPAQLAARFRQGDRAHRPAELDGGRRQRFEAKQAESATRSSPARTPPPPIIWPASSTMRPAV